MIKEKIRKSKTKLNNAHTLISAQDEIYCSKCYLRWERNEDPPVKYCTNKK